MAFRCNGMHLQADESFCIYCINQISSRNSVNPCFCFVANALYFKMIVFACFICMLRRCIQLHGIQPFSTAFIINTARPSAPAGIYFALPAIHFTFSVIGVCIKMASCLHTGITFFIFYKHIQFQHKISIFLFCYQECITGIGNCAADDDAVFYGESCFSAQ